jgi:type I restriction enzyme, S subunit
MIPPVSILLTWLSLRVANVQNWKLDLNDRNCVELPSDVIERYTVQLGDLLMARAIASVDHLGKCIVANPGDQKWTFDSHEKWASTSLSPPGTDHPAHNR